MTSIEEPHNTEVPKSQRRSADWDTKNAVSNYGTLLISQIANGLFSFLTVILCTRTLGAEGWGLVMLIIATSSTSQILVNWTGVALARFGVEEYVESGFVSKTFWTRTLILLPNIAVVLGGFLAAYPLIGNKLGLNANSLPLIVAHFLVLTVWLHVQYSFQATKQLKLQGVLLSLERFLILLGVVGLIAVGYLTPLSILVVYVISPLIFLSYGITAVRSFVSRKVIYDEAVSKKMAKFSLPLIPYSIVGFLSTSYLDTFFLNHYMGKSDIGIYSVAYQICGVLMQVPAVAGSVLLSLFVSLGVEGKKDKITSYMTEISPVLSFFWGIGCFVATLFAGLIGNLALPGNVEVFTQVFLILLCSTAVSAPIALGYSPYLSEKANTRVTLYLALITAGTNIALNVLLIPRYGLIGCAIATAASYVFGLCYLGLVMHKSYGISPVPAFLSVLPLILYVVAYLTFSSSLIALGVFLVAIVVFAVLRGRSLVTSYKFFSNYLKGFIGNRSS